jgi:hypothetical protein
MASSSPLTTSSRALQLAITIRQISAGTGLRNRSEGGNMFLRVLTFTGAQHVDEGLRFIRDEVTPVCGNSTGTGGSLSARIAPEGSSAS